MNTNGPSGSGWLRRLLKVFALAGLLVLVFSCFDPPAGQSAKSLSQRIHQAELFLEQPRGALMVSRDDARMTGAIGKVLPWRAADTPYPARPSTRQPPPLQFKFLGKITEGDETSVLLHDGGRILTVRGTGPLDDEYVVDAIGEAYLVLRNVSLNESQIIELASRGPTVATGWSAENTPPD